MPSSRAQRKLAPESVLEKATSTVALGFFVRTTSPGCLSIRSGGGLVSILNEAVAGVGSLTPFATA